MIRYTTPTFHFDVKGVDLTGQNVYVSIEQNNTELLKKGNDLTISVETVEERPITHITFSLSQEESAVFKCGSGAAQVNWVSSEGVRGATGIKPITIQRNLLDSVISYED